MPTVNYPSRIDRWLIAVAIGALIFQVALFLMTFQANRSAAWIYLGTLLFCVVLIAAFLPCRYILNEDHLLIRSGVWKQRIPYGDIIDARKTYNPLSAPALSLRRVQIDLEKGFRLVSPEDRDEFITSLLERVRQAKEC